MMGGCTVDVRVLLPGVGTGLADDEAPSDTGETDGDDNVDDLGVEDETGSSALDFPAGEGFAEQSCRVVEHDAPLPCERPLASGVINPTVGWTWTGPGGEDSVIVTPLVANLDDDNHDGGVDLCDTPDVIVVAVNLPLGKSDQIPPGHIYVIDSRTGATKFQIDHPIDATATPAVADLDGDGVAELIAYERRSMIEPGQIGTRRVVAFTAAGELLWIADNSVLSEGGGAISIADLDADGVPEIIAAEHVLSADGERLWTPPDPPMDNSIPVAVDLDLDGDLEILFGGSAYSHTGELLFELDVPGSKNAGIAAIANFDDDPYPEIYVQGATHRILEHDGQPKAQCGVGAARPVALEDVDHDGNVELISALGSWLSVLNFVDDGCETLWSSKIGDPNTRSSATAFDLLGDGEDELIFAGQDSVQFFSSTGALIAEVALSARSSSANPIVVDADNDGAAEIVVVGSEPLGGGDLDGRVSLMLIENVDDGFAPTRRIWNQHPYHRTNIREDATVPTDQSPQWLGPNSFRTNSAPSYAGSLCQPPPVD